MCIRDRVYTVSLATETCTQSCYKKLGFPYLLLSKVWIIKSPINSKRVYTLVLKNGLPESTGHTIVVILMIIINNILYFDQEYIFYYLLQCFDSVFYIRRWQKCKIKTVKIL